MQLIPFKLIRFRKIDPNVYPFFFRCLYNHDGYMTTLLKTITHQFVTPQVLFEGDVDPQLLTLSPIKINNPFQRIVTMQAKNKNLIIGRSFWDRNAYKRLIFDNKKGIGENMMKQKAEYRREITMKAKSDTQIQGKPLEDVDSRSYQMFSGGELVCQIQQYFLPQLLKYQ